jgi:hypothetical protein
MDLRGYVQGTVFGMNWDDEARTISWANIGITSGANTYNWYTWDGWFDGYLDPGAYQAKIAEWTNGGAGHQVYQFALKVTAGQSGTETITLIESNIAIPEFTNALPLAFTALTFTLIALRPRRSRRGAGSYK